MRVAETRISEPLLRRGLRAAISYLRESDDILEYACHEDHCAMAHQETPE